MKKTKKATLLSIIIFVSLAVFNCSKKEDPTPAPNTIINNGSGNGNGSTGITPKDSTVTPKDSTVVVVIPPTIGGSGTFTFDGVTYVPKTIYPWAIAMYNMTSITASHEDYQLNIEIGKIPLVDGVYPITEVTPTHLFPLEGEAMVEIKNLNNSFVYRAIPGDNVVVSGKNIKIVSATFGTDPNDRKIGSCNLTLK